MSIDLTGIQNVGEFYSHHYLDALLEKDLKGLFDRWRKADDEATPDRRLSRCATGFFRAKTQALRQPQPEMRYQSSHSIHVMLLEALGYPYDFSVRYLADGMAVPVLGVVRRDGRPYLWLVETTFTKPDDAPLDQIPFRDQYPPSVDDDGYDIPAEPWETLVGEVFRCAEPPRWLVLFAGRFVYLIDRTKWGQGQYLLFDLDEILGRRQRDTLRATAALLSRDALCPDEGVPLHDTLDENSHKHAYGVSEDLKYGVRRAVELLANEYVWYQRNVGKQALFGDDDLAKKLTAEALTYLYRLLFLFYAEARGGELGLVPMKSESYRTGYSLETLRDLEQVPLTTPQAQDGTFIQKSLDRLFDLVNEGFPREFTQYELRETEQPLYDNYGFTVTGLRSPLFDRASTPLLSSVRLRNVVLQEALQLLSLSREQRGRSTRGRISYAQLGINQLGAVYEGLLSYTGFFAQEEMVEVQPAEASTVKEAIQTYFVPESEIERYEKDEIVYEDGVRKTYPKGSFIFRLAGRDREKYASYYTPEVLTRCVVKYSLKELLQGKSADDILELTICEPAMGSGAFINEALNQLSDAYLVRKQKETRECIPPDQYREERQRVKAYMASHNAYGVDLNPMAVELAQVSVWLNTIYPAMAAPWYGARMAVGNSLVGARRQVYSAKDVRSGDYADKAPIPVPLGQPRPEGSVYHWLLPDKGMAAFDKDKVIRDLTPGGAASIKGWRKGFTAKITAAELGDLQALSDLADDLWERHARERQALLDETRDPIPLWGQPAPPADFEPLSVQGKQKALARLNRPTSPFRRLKLAMDYWCALWFWPISEATQLPTRQQFLNSLADVLRGVEGEYERLPEQVGLFDEPVPKQAHLAELAPVSVDVLCQENVRLAIAQETAERVRFHHWELAFAEVFDDHGGFDIIIGNPPWVKLGWNEAGLLSEYDPLLAIRRFTASEVANQRSTQLANLERSREYLSEYAEIAGSISFFSAMQNYPLLQGIQKSNLYKSFLSRSWSIGAADGIVGLLHPEGIYEDPKGGALREEVYTRLRSHFQFHNELKLFPEVHNQVRYSVNVYQATKRSSVMFSHCVNLFHPATIDRCFAHDGAGQVPGIRDSNGEWELRGHRNRIIEISKERLSLFCDLYDSTETPVLWARLPVVHSKEIARVLGIFSQQSVRLGDLKAGYFPTVMWDQAAAQKEGIIRKEVRYPDDAGELIISGSHFHVANPFYKNPNEGCRNNRDYVSVDLTTIPDDFLPRTTFVPACSQSDYRKRMPHWDGAEIIERYKHIHRRMLGPTSERTLINAIMAPGIGHLNVVFSLTFKSSQLLVEFSGLCSSIAYDFFVKSTGRNDMYEDLAASLPLPRKPRELRFITNRALRLNCLTVHYAALWEELYTDALPADSWAKRDMRLKEWDDLSHSWQRSVALRIPFERRQALVELDVLAAQALELTLDELITVYRVQFPVLQKYESRLLFDQRGKAVPVRTTSGELGPNEDHPDLADMVPPFTSVDREADYREAWAYFERLL